MVGITCWRPDTLQNSLSVSTRGNLRGLSAVQLGGVVKGFPSEFTTWVLVASWSWGGGGSLSPFVLVMVH